MTTTRKHAELKNLAKQAKDNIYRMLQLATEILSDHEYVDQYGGEAALIDHMEDTEFSHFGGTPKLAAMLRAYRHTPAIEVWRENRFNVWSMIELSTPQKKEKRTTGSVSWKARCKELELEKKLLQDRVGELNAEIGKLHETIEGLQKQLGKLEAIANA